MLRQFLIGVVFLALVTPAHAHSDYGLVIHMQQTTDFINCDAPGSPQDPDLTCDAIQEIGLTSSQQKAWIIAYGWDLIPGFPVASGLGGVEFGMEWDPTVQVLLWVNCTPGLDLPDPGWPASGLGVASTWLPGQYPLSEFARIGYLVLAPGSEGRMAIIEHAIAAPVPAVKFASGYPNPQEFVVPPEGWSSADVGGTNPDNAYKACDIGPPTPTVERSWGRIKETFGD